MSEDGIYADFERAGEEATRIRLAAGGYNPKHAAQAREWLQRKESERKSAVEAAQLDVAARAALAAERAANASERAVIASERAASASERAAAAAERASLAAERANTRAVIANIIAAIAAAVAIWALLK